MRNFFLFGIAITFVLLACERFDEAQPLDPARDRSEQPSPTPPPISTVIITPTPPSTLPPSPLLLPVDEQATPEIPKSQSPLKVYEDNVFGFRIDYPLDWDAFAIPEAPRIAQMGSNDGGSAQSVVYLLYQTNIFTSDAALDTQIPSFLDRQGFRQLKEEELVLEDGTKAFRVVYQWRETDGLWQGSLFAVAQNSQNFFILTEAPQSTYLERAEDIRAMLSSFKLTDPTPLGIDRKEALTLFLDNGPITLDPAIAKELSTAQYIAHIFSGLVSFDSNLNLIADLAENWEISEDGTVYTFTIKANARFHDGRSVTASDVKYSWERAAAPSTGSTIAGVYFDDIVGMGAVLAGMAEEATGIEVVDARTLRVTIDTPKAYFLSKLSHHTAFVVDREEVALDPYWWSEPNGTGPFKMRFWDRDLFILEANTEYYETPPAIPFVIFRLYGGIPLLMYKGGEIDVASLYSEDIKEARDSQDALNDQIQLTKELSVYYVGFSSDKPPFDDPLVRRAFMLAIDREKLIEDLFTGSREVAQGFMPQGLPGFDPSILAIPYDPGEALRLLAKSSYGGAEGLPPIIYTTSGVVVEGSTVDILLKMWKKNLGIQVQPRVLDETTYFYYLSQRRDNMYDYGWIADYPDPHNFMDVLFHSGAENNVGKFSNSKVDTLLEKARVEQDNQVRYDLYRKAEKLVVDEAAAIPLNFGRSYIATKPYVKGLVFTPLGMMDLKGVTLGSR
ncbi:MAG: hypothetical protein BZY82_09620 [SAR202 cluster bacterium Io17-Chloro-G3]|nr:MAG: hypothetical protein BZY82_09620 [SAR202 cluster bacterium Io17-Chloro-G3]